MKRFALAACLLLCSVACGQSKDADSAALKGRAAPDIALKTVAGGDAKLSDQKGKVVLIDFWATWCGPCRRSLPHVQELATNKALADKGLVVWAVNVRETKAKVEAFLKNNKFTFTVPMDSDGKAGTAYQVQGIPTTVIVGKDGKVKDVFVGFSPESSKALDEAVKKALEEK